MQKKCWYGYYPINMSVIFGLLSPFHFYVIFSSSRLYLINSPVVRAENLRFKEEGVRDVLKDVLLPWFNAYRFFIQNVLRLQKVWVAVLWSGVHLTDMGLQKIVRAELWGGVPWETRLSRPHGWGLVAIGEAIDEGATVVWAVLSQGEQDWSFAIWADAHRCQTQMLHLFKTSCIGYSFSQPNSWWESK